MMKHWIASVILCVAAAPVMATQATYDLSIRGFHVGIMTLAAQEQGRSYSVAGQIQNTGLLRVFRSFKYQGKAQGQITGAGLSTTKYTERADTGKRVSEVDLAYARGIPQVLHLSPPPDPEAERLVPASLGPTVDPLTAIYALLRDTTQAQSCKFDLHLFDGQRLSRLYMGPAGQDESGLPVCKGKYLRLRGYAPDEIDRHTEFPFTLRYQAAGDALQVKSLNFRTDYGKAEVHRR